MPIAAHLVKFKLLLFFQILANAGLLAIGLAALGQFIVLAFVQAVHLIVEIAPQFSAGVRCLWLARGKCARRDQQEGPN
ncbi:MAG TPA: hypothetical protein VGK22_06395 [Candidatus Angelobacter sp.]